MHSRKSLFGLLGVFLLSGIAVLAQQPQTPATAPDETLRKERIEQRAERHRQRMERHRERGELEGHRRMGRHGGMGRMMRELKLSDEQRQQSRAIVQRRLEATKGQREELFRLREKRIAGTFTADDEARAKALRQEMRNSMDGIQDEMSGVLTAEQKARLEEMKKERKERMEQRIRERQERLNNKPQ